MGYALDLNVFRMVGIDSGTEWVGSKIAQFSLITTHWKNSTQRKVSLIKFSELSATSINDMLSKKTGGVTVILDSVERSQEHIIWDEVYSRLGIRRTLFPPRPQRADHPHLLHLPRRSHSQALRGAAEPFRVRLPAPGHQHRPKAAAAAGRLLRTFFPFPRTSLTRPRTSGPTTRPRSSSLASTRTCRRPKSPSNRSASSTASSSSSPASCCTTSDASKAASDP